MSLSPVASSCCYICTKSNSKSLRRWESKTGCSTCRNYFNSIFDSAFKAIKEIKIDNIEQDISDENGKVMSVFWKSINSKMDCYRMLNCRNFLNLCIHKGHPISKCNKCQFRKMFFIFAPPCTKNAKTNLAQFIKIKESWSLIKLRLKERIAGNEIIDMGNEIVENVDYLAEKTARSVSKNKSGVKSKIDIGMKSQKSGYQSVNITSTYRTGGKHKFKAQKLVNDSFRTKIHELKSKSICKPDRTNHRDYPYGTNIGSLSVHRVTTQYRRHMNFSCFLFLVFKIQDFVDVPFSRTRSQQSIRPLLTNQPE